MWIYPRIDPSWQGKGKKKLKRQIDDTERGTCSGDVVAVSFLFTDLASMLGLYLRGLVEPIFFFNCIEMEQEIREGEGTN